MPSSSLALPQKIREYLSKIEWDQLLQNSTNTYVYCNKARSKMADIVAQIAHFDADKDSPVWQLKRHIEDGNSIGLKDAILHALAHAERIILRKLSSEQVEQIHETLNSVIDQVTEGKLTVDIQSALASQKRNELWNEENEILRSCRTVNVKDKVRFFKDVTFKDDVKFKEDVKFEDEVKFEDDATFKSNVLVEGTLSAADAILGCDLTVGCSINLNNSTDPVIGNINKDGDRFIHNFGDDNTFVGIDAGNFSMTGQENTGIGAFALTSLTSGTLNTASGLLSLASNTSGSVNTANGAIALITNSSGSANTAMGFLAMVSNSTGSGNTAMGVSALINSNGDDNTAIGAGALDSNSTGSGNVALGADAGTSLVNGDDNIYISADGASTESGIIRIGRPTTHTTAFIQGIFGVNIGISGSAVEINSAGKLGTIISKRAFKRNINDMSAASENIYRLRPVTFSYISDENDTIQYGLIADEVAEIFPELIVNDQEGNPFSVRYQILPVLLLNEVQKQNAYIKALADRVAALEARA